MGNNKRAIQDFKGEIKHHFAIKEEGETKEYIGCKVKKTWKRSQIMYQDDLINKIEKNFGELTGNMQEYGLPAWSGKHITRPDEDEPKISSEDQRKYRSVMGMLLYLVKFQDQTSQMQR